MIIMKKNINLRKGLALTLILLSLGLYPLISQSSKQTALNPKNFKVTGCYEIIDGEQWLGVKCYTPDPNGPCTQVSDDCNIEW